MADHQIRIEGFAYVPTQLEIQPGDTVTWTNLDAGMAHTATSAEGAAHTFDTGDIATNESKSHTFDDVSAGNEIGYLCTHHSFMQATIIVTAAPAVEATEHAVTIEGFAYNPTELEIRPGDTVTWTNRDNGMPHTATASTGAAEIFDTGDLAQDQSGSHKFERVSAGDEVPYTCTHHAFMLGKIIVV